MIEFIIGFVLISLLCCFIFYVIQMYIHCLIIAPGYSFMNILLLSYWAAAALTFKTIIIFCMDKV